MQSEAEAEDAFALRVEGPGSARIRGGHRSRPDRLPNDVAGEQGPMMSGRRGVTFQANRKGGSGHRRRSRVVDLTVPHAWYLVACDGRRLSVRERLLRGVSSLGGSSPALTGLLASVLILTACGPQKPTTTYEPTIVGVVEESNAGYDQTITLGDGQTIEVAEGRSLTEGRPSGGELFLGGVDQRGLWFQDARPGTPDCPFILRSNAWDDGRFVILASGLRLPKANGFIGEPRVLGPEGPPILCLNEDAEATSAR